MLCIRADQSPSQFHIRIQGQTVRVQTLSDTYRNAATKQKFETSATSNKLLCFMSRHHVIIHMQHQLAAKTVEHTLRLTSRTTGTHQNPRL